MLPWKQRFLVGMAFSIYKVNLLKACQSHSVFVYVSKDGADKQSMGLTSHMHNLITAYSMPKRSLSSEGNTCRRSELNEYCPSTDVLGDVSFRHIPQMTTSCT